MTEYSPIVSGRAIPPIKRKGAKPKYNWTAMKPGQAFRFSDDITFSSAVAQASNRGKDFAMRFVVRQEDDGLWCYRVDGLSSEPRNGNIKENLKVVDRDPHEATQEQVAGYGADEI